MADIKWNSPSSSRSRSNCMSIEPLTISFNITISAAFWNYRPRLSRWNDGCRLNGIWPIRTELTTRAFCLPFAQTVDKPVFPCKWLTNRVFVTLKRCAYQKASHNYSNESYLYHRPYRTDHKKNWSFCRTCSIRHALSYVFKTLWQWPRNLQAKKM